MPVEAGDARTYLLTMLPALFVSHGAPTLPFDDVPARDFLRGLGATFEKPKAVLCVSAHWDTDLPALTTTEANSTIHDFHGFPDALYRLRYDAPGAPDLAARAAGLLKDAGWTVAFDRTRGLDHGAWVPMLLMYPERDIPVLQMSVQSADTPARHIALGRALAPLREEGVLILASGGYIHNLRQLDRNDRAAPEPTWSAVFGDWMHDALIERRDDDLANYRRRAPEAARAQPSEEHIMPLFVAYGAGAASTRLHKSTTFGSLRMDAYAFSSQCRLRAHKPDVPSRAPASLIGTPPSSRNGAEPSGFSARYSVDGGNPTGTAHCPPLCPAA